MYNLILSDEDIEGLHELARMAGLAKANRLMMQVGNQVNTQQQRQAALAQKAATEAAPPGPPPPAPEPVSKAPTPRAELEPGMEALPVPASEDVQAQV